jgi:hypothetical protein
VEKAVICTFTQEHHEFQRKKGKKYFPAASAILFVWVTNSVILPLGKGAITWKNGSHSYETYQIMNFVLTSKCVNHEAIDTGRT